MLKGWKATQSSKILSCHSSPFFVDTSKGEERAEGAGEGTLLYIVQRNRKRTQGGDRKDPGLWFCWLPFSSLHIPWKFSLWHKLLHVHLVYFWPGSLPLEPAQPLLGTSDKSGFIWNSLLEEAGLSLSTCQIRNAPFGLMGLAFGLIQKTP